MNFKIDTKEKFHEISILEPNLTANMTDAIEDLFQPFLEKEPKNIILSLLAVQSLDSETAARIVSIQQNFYEHHASFVIWGLNPAVENKLDEEEMLEHMNVTPTLSEAWDIVQMEEIERELLDHF
jgi:anti-anti-sigma factor